MMKPLCESPARRICFFFFLEFAAMLLWDGVFWPTTIAPTAQLCEAFVLPGASHNLLQTQTRKSFSEQYRERNRWVTTTTIRLRDDFDDDEFCEDCDEASIPKRRRTERKNESSSQRRDGNDDQLRRSSQHNLSRRDFVVMNSILAGLATGAAASVPGTSAVELLFWKDKAAAASPPSNAEAIRSSTGNLLSMEAVQEPYSSIRNYKSLTLSNGMRVLLVRDNVVRQPSAALTINGAGQFSDPTYLNGLAHLMEHIVLSSRPGTSWSNQGDFQEWLERDDAEGFSNGFTAYEKVCFHFQCETEVFAEALDRFSNLFLDKVIEENCRNREAVRREIRRVDSELDKNDLFSREKYLTKSLINPKHPYAKMTLGSIETLETLPVMADINVSQELYNFFEDKYQPTEAILVVVSSEKLSSLENMVQSFSTTMSKREKYQISSSFSSSRDEKKQTQKQTPPKEQQRIFPPFLLPGNPVRPICLFRGKVSNEILANDLEKISFQWALDQDYSGLKQTTDFLSISNPAVTATQIGFVMAEIFGRRGPGSLFKILKKRKWIPEGNRGVPRISFPVDVSGFQILRLEIVLTLEGFSKRSSIIAAVFDCLACLRENPPSRELIAQYCCVAQLYGHVLAPRPPDAIELAFDAQIYGVDGPNGVGTPKWRLLPLPEDTAGIHALQKTMQSVLTRISDPSSAITIVTASQRSIISQKINDLEEPFPMFSPASWTISPTTHARYLSQNSVLTGRINEWMVARIMDEKLSPPVLNPLIPPTLRPPRMVPPGVPMKSLLNSNNEDDPHVSASVTSNNDEFEKPFIVRDYWALLQAYSHNDWLPSPGLTIPRMPPEPSSRSVFVLQLLSSRPPRASSEMAAHAEVWRISLEYDLVELSELGAPAGLAYEISYNNYGMRVAFLGLSQNLPSYARRIARRMIDHTNQLLEGPEEIDPKVLEASIRNTNRFRMAPNRKQQVVGSLRQTTALDAAREGTAFFRSCSGAVCFSQGDLLPTESLAVLADLKEIFRKATGTNVSPTPVIPEVKDLLYRAKWIPRAASVCAIPGASLVSNPCGRVPR
jgi:insulysin